MNGKPGDLRVEPPAGDDESLREYGRQLAMDVLLQLALQTPPDGGASPGPITTAPDRSRRRWSWIAAVAVCLLVAIALFEVYRRAHIDPPIIARNPVADPPRVPEMPAPKARPEFADALAGWTVEPAGNAAFQVDALNRILLDRGELHLVSAPANDRQPIQIETSLGTITASDEAEFLIGAHPSSSPTETGAPMNSSLMRVLVLAGMVTVTTPSGSLTGESGHLLAAERDKPPVNFAVEASNGFAFDLYGELSRKNPDSGLFFSPYSLSVALAMTAEGARGETARQMAQTLHFPDAARRVGNDAQVIPFNVALLHTGYADFSKRWNPNRDGDRLVRVRMQIEMLRKELANANQQAADLRKAGKDEASNVYALKSQEVAARLNGLLSQVDRFELRVANALWGEKTYPFRQEFLETIGKYYGTGGVFPVDFQNQYEAARQQINRWAAEQTLQKIPELISRSALSPEDGKFVRLILTNAIYFRGEWSTVFPETETRETDFLLAGGSKIRVPLMHHGYLGAGYAAFNADGTPFDTPREVPIDGKQPQVYPDEDGFTMLELSYKGDELSMVLIAPRSPDKLPAIEKLLKGDRWPGLAKTLVGRAVDTYVPRFKLTQSFELSDAMKSLGMVRPFEIPRSDGSGAEFGGMGASDDYQHKLYIGKVLHAAQVEVTEKGTEAAAATAVIAPAPKSAVVEMRPFTPQFRADRPFTFLIRDRKSGTVLFLGRMTNPGTT